MLIAGRYRLLDLVGRGGMGRVWRAHDEMLHREVAVKEIVPPSWLADHERAELRSRTLREARAAARLNHPAVVRLYDVIPVEGSPWIVMEYVPSRTLQDLVDAEASLEPARAARIGLAVLDALQAAHTAGVLHRDIKPQNVLMAHDGRVMLTDFGLATFDGGDGAMTRPGMVLGSPQYVAPERAAEGASTVAADLWSLGATLYAAVEGRSPYARSTAMATLSALAAGPPDPAPHAGSLAPVLAGLLRRDPRDRLDHDSARRLLTAAATGRTDPPPVSEPSPPTASGDVGSAAGVGDSTSTSPASALTRPEGRRRARRVALVVVALLVAAAAGVGTALAVTDDEPSGTVGGPTAPPPYGPPPEGPGPDRPGRPPGGRDVPRPRSRVSARTSPVRRCWPVCRPRANGSGRRPAGSGTPTVPASGSPYRRRGITPATARWRVSRTRRPAGPSASPRAAPPIPWSGCGRPATRRPPPGPCRSTTRSDSPPTTAERSGSAAGRHRTGPGCTPGNRSLEPTAGRWAGSPTTRTGPGPTRTGWRCETVSGHPADLHRIVMIRPLVRGGSRPLSG